MLESNQHGPASDWQVPFSRSGFAAHPEAVAVLRKPHAAWPPSPAARQSTKPNGRNTNQEPALRRFRILPQPADKGTARKTPCQPDSVDRVRKGRSSTHHETVQGHHHIPAWLPAPSPVPVSWLPAAVSVDYARN